MSTVHTVIITLTKGCKSNFAMLNLLNESAITEYIQQAIKTEISKVVVPQKEWLNLSEVCDTFHLSKNNVKNRKWRDKNAFPYCQAAGICGSVVYPRSKVEEWLKKRSRNC